MATKTAKMTTTEKPSPKTAKAAEAKKQAQPAAKTTTATATKSAAPTKAASKTSQNGKKTTEKVAKVNSKAIEEIDQQKVDEVDQLSETLKKNAQVHDEVEEEDDEEILEEEDVEEEEDGEEEEEEEDDEDGDNESEDTDEPTPVKNVPSFKSAVEQQRKAAAQKKTLVNAGKKNQDALAAVGKAKASLEAKKKKKNGLDELEGVQDNASSERSRVSVANATKQAAKKRVLKKTKAYQKKEYKDGEKLTQRDTLRVYRARLSVMDAKAFKVLDNKWISVFEPALRKKNSFTEGAFPYAWTRVLHEIALAKGVNILGVLPHYSKCQDGLPVFEVKPEYVEESKKQLYIRQGLDGVSGKRIYVGKAYTSKGEGNVKFEASPFSILPEDTKAGDYWKAINKVDDVSPMDTA